MPDGYDRKDETERDASAIPLWMAGVLISLFSASDWLS